ncbi:MAG: DNA polymerase III subunit epsilon [Rhodocyclaceae bacterium]|jgi:DNA polymerase-3 subunit epsilon|nr:MAG: DNA polymerase III subunit epsilon [Rhodocyclaceae bacterium]
MRQIVLDTETTGLEWQQGHRVIEIGCVEIVGRKLTGRRFHRYLNPGREIDPGAQAVHGITAEFLADKPRFGEIVAELIDVIRGAELVIHNAAFDVGFLDNELGLLGMAPLAEVCGGVVDTLKLAKELNPGKRASLDVLCDRYEIDNSGRTLHGALLDAELLAEVYLAMTRGQESLVMDLDLPQAAEGAGDGAPVERVPLRVLCANADELAAHEKLLDEITKEAKGRCVWRPAVEGGAGA